VDFVKKCEVMVYLRMMVMCLSVKKKYLLANLGQMMINQNVYSIGGAP
jgi:hypothetical protein